MDMFNWRAPKGSSVVSPRFWIYWVVTVPLTLVVLTIWSIWLQKHHKHETQRKTPGRGLPSDSTTDILEETLTGKTRPWYMNTLIKIIHKIMDMSPAREAESGHSTVGASTSLEARGRAPRVQVQRTDTVLPEYQNEGSNA
jgi:hypothetical protein